MYEKVICPWCHETKILGYTHHKCPSFGCSIVYGIKGCGPFWKIVGTNTPCGDPPKNGISHVICLCGFSGIMNHTSGHQCPIVGVKIYCSADQWWIWGSEFKTPVDFSRHLGPKPTKEPHVHYSWDFWWR